jgi:phosphoribosyl-ATP pyrophosphohydrolase
MARYIDADKVTEEINRIGGHNLCEWETLGVKALIDRQPTADVVPKSEVERLQSQVNRLKKYDEERDIALHARLITETREKVAREIFEEIDGEIKLALDSNYKARSQVELSDELYHTVNGKISALRGIDDFLAELKKKYT